MAELTYAQVSALLNYDPETGKLFWKERPAELFNGGAKGGRKAAAQTWNHKFSGKEAFTPINNEGYRNGALFAKSYKAHRVAWLLYYRTWPEGEVDHQNGDRSDNRICNLRDGSKSQNQRNSPRKRTNTSGFGGVSWHKQSRKWVARATINGTYKYLGLFVELEEAIAARLKANEEHGYSERHGI